MQDTNNKNAPLELGRLIHILSCKMKCQNDCYTILEDSDLTPVQQQLLKFILLESAHKPIFQRDIEEAFQIRRSTVAGIPDGKHGACHQEYRRTKRPHTF